MENTGSIHEEVSSDEDEEENSQTYLTLAVQLQLVMDKYAIPKAMMHQHLQLYVLKHIEMMGQRGQQIPAADTADYV
ncbi:hypothetical protein C0995_011205, partial [Termitomyces sp. Mi166